MRARALTGLAVVVLLAGCGADDADDGGDRAAPTATTAAATPTGAATSTDVYVVQEAGEATLTSAADGTATLTLRDARPDSITFTGADDPQAASAPNADVLDALFAEDTGHDAALSFTSPTDAGTLVVTLTAGTWDAATSTLTYEVRPVEVAELASATVAARAGEAPATELPEDVTSSSLFIDPVESDRLVADCDLTVVNDTAWNGTVGSIDADDPNGMVDWDTPFTVGQVIEAGQQASAASGAYAFGCGATVTMVFDEVDDYAVYITMDDPVFSKSSWNCAAPPEIGCEVSANESDQPMKMTVTLRT